MASKAWHVGIVGVTVKRIKLSRRRQLTDTQTLPGHGSSVILGDRHANMRCSMEMVSAGFALFALFFSPAETRFPGLKGNVSSGRPLGMFLVSSFSRVALSLFFVAHQENPS